MQACVNFAGLSLTEIFEVQGIQTLLIKFWYLGLTSDCIIAKDDLNTFKTIKKAINFANCFTFEMPLKTYINFVERINRTLNKLNPNPIFEVLLGHLKNNKINSISFELFGVAFLQLFGRVLELLNSQNMGQILREIYKELTVITKSGTAMMKTDKSLIKEIDFENYVPNFNNLPKQESVDNQKTLLNPEQTSINIHPSKISSTTNPRDLKTLRGRLQSQAQFNSEIRDAEPGQYSTGQKMKNREKANISCFVMGGFEIVDYSESINQLHRKLLTKILLNK